MSTRIHLGLALVCVLGACGQTTTPDADQGVDAGSLDAGSLDAGSLDATAPPPDAGWPPTCTTAGTIVCGWRPEAPAIPTTSGADGFYGAAVEGPLYSLHRLDPRDPWGELTALDGISPGSRPWVFRMAAGVRYATFADGRLSVHDLTGANVGAIDLGTDYPLGIHGAGDEILVELPGATTGRYRQAIHADGVLVLETDDGPRSWVWPAPAGRPWVTRYDTGLLAGVVGEALEPLDTHTCTEPLGGHALLPMGDGSIVWVVRCGDETHLSTRTASGEVTTSSYVAESAGAKALSHGPAGTLLLAEALAEGMSVRMIDAATHEELAAGRVELPYFEAHESTLPLAEVEVADAAGNVFTVRAEGLVPPILYQPNLPMLGVCQLCLP